VYTVREAGGSCHREKRLRNRLRHPTHRESQPCGLRALAKGPLRRPRNRFPRCHPPGISDRLATGPARHTCGVRMNRPILEVRDLRTYFFPEEGTVRAVDGAHLDV